MTSETGVHCHNKYCNNTLPQHRVDRIGTNVSRAWFCIDCLRKGREIRYKCGNPHCDTYLSFDIHPKKYCKNQCWRTVYLDRIKALTPKKCKVCETVFAPKNRLNRFCSRDCFADYRRKYNRQFCGYTHRKFSTQKFANKIRCA